METNTSRRNAVEPMKNFRDGESFTNYELMLGFLSYIFWDFGGKNIPDILTENQLVDWILWYYRAGNDTTARECAINTVVLIIKCLSVVSILSKAKPTMNIEKELYWAKNKLNPPQWSST